MSLGKIYLKIKNHHWLVQKNRGGNYDPFIFEPQLLLDETLKLGLLWSAKSACTFSIKWFFKHQNLLDAAQHYHPWIHHYRLKVYYASQGYQRAMNAFKQDPASFTVIKIVRDPFSRAVSSFFGIPKRYYFNDYRPKELKDIERFVGRKIPSKEGETISFSEFIHYLEQTDISRVDIHWREQLHPLERDGTVIPIVIKVEHVGEELRKLENSLMLTPTDLNAFNKSSHHLKKDQDSKGFWGNERIKYNHKFEYPEYHHFYTDELERKVVKIYKNDFIHYDYLQKIVRE